MTYLRKQKNIDKVLIHDAARPNFSKKLIKNIFMSSRKNRTVIPILKLQDALKKKHKKNNTLSMKRDNFFTTQTPQCFNLNEIFKLHKNDKKNM